MSLDSDVDPDIAAAFSDHSPSTPSAGPSVDSDIADAFKEPKKKDAAKAGEKTDGVTGFVNGLAETAGKGILNIPHAAAHAGVDLYRRWTGGDTSAPDPSIVNSLSVPLSQNAQNASGAVGTSLQAAAQPYRVPAIERGLNSNAVTQYVAPVVGDVAALAPVAGLAKGVSGLASDGKSLTPRPVPPAPPVLSAEDVVKGSVAQQSMGAAADGGASQVSRLSPETQQEISRAGTAGKPINQDAYQRHLDAETLPLPDGTSPLRLRKGQATGDAQQISDEKNLRADPDTQGILTDSITDQDKKLVASMGEIRRSATPDIVQRNNLEHAQTAIDSIKNVDNQAVLDTRAKYKALEAANGGTMPIDTGTAGANIEAKLSKKLLTKTAASDPQISEVLDNLKSGKPMDFEGFEAARTGLAEVQRQGGSAATAAGIVRSELENMPLSAGAQKLKGLADDARAAAKKRFDTIEQNPAYDAAVNDNVPKDKNGLHVIGAPSPLADSFMDRYALGNGANASSAYVQRLKSVMQNDPEFSKSIEASALNKLRDAAGVDAYGGGSFRNDMYRNARKAMEPKESVLLSPESIERTNQLKRVSGYVNDEGKASSTNRSNTMLALQRFGAQFPAGESPVGAVGSHVADLAVAHTLGPAGVIAKNVGKSLFKNSQDAKAVQALKDAKLKFAMDATKPGAGIAP